MQNEPENQPRANPKQTMNNAISPLKRALGVLVAVMCLSSASAADEAVSPPTTNSVSHVNAQQAQKLIADKKIVVLDIRTPEEFAAGRIAGATNINFRAADFAQRLAGLDKSQTYVVHCATGNRSTQALPTFDKLQFKSLYHLDGGIKGWDKAGLPVQK
jgi:phage shock protein E